MSEASKAITRKFLRALGAGDAATLKTIVTEGVEVITPGSGDICGTRNYRVIMAVAAAFAQITKAGIEFRILHLTAEDDRVAC